MSTYPRPGLPPEKKRLSGLAIVGIIVGSWCILWLVILIFSWLGSRATPQAGEIGVTRSGPSHVWAPAFFNGHGIRGVVAPGSGSTYIGLGSTVHWYPADNSQRIYTITSDPRRGDRPGVDVVQDQTSDGVLMGIEGTFYFKTNFNGGPAGQNSVRAFDNQFGVRTFPVVGSSTNGGEPKQVHAYDGTVGWEAFLDANIRPIIENDLRRSIANVTCAQLVSSCALVKQNNGGVQKGTQVIANGGQTNSQKIQQIQDQIQSSLESDIQATLGQDYFSEGGRHGVIFLLAKPTLPGKIQNEIDNAQAAYAAVNTSAAKVQQATQDKLANQQREQGYKACPACAEAAILAAIPGNVTTFAPGAGFAITK